MNLAAHVLYRVVHHLMLELVEAFIGFQSIGEDCGTRKNLFADLLLHLALASVRNDCHANLTAARQDAHSDSLVLASSVPVIFLARLLACMLRALPPMKVSSASIWPESLLNVPVCIAWRIR